METHLPTPDEVAAALAAISLWEAEHAAKLEAMHGMSDVATPWQASIKLAQQHIVLQRSPCALNWATIERLRRTS